MPKIEYVPKKFSDEHRQVIDRANTILRDYARRGYDLTLRQLYYQFVSRNWLRNTVQSYKRLGGIVSEARRAGLIDWSHIVDRTRNLRAASTWGSPADIVGACARQFDVDLWADQGFRVEAWVEKDALIGVLEVACRRHQIPYFSCRGYTSDSEVWSAAQRMRGHVKGGQKVMVLHLGDHDPSGIDMTRDIRERIELFGDVGENEVEIRRIALNMPQIEQYGPPPNPAKETDSRYRGYQELHGDESWELDALSPEVITELIHTEAERLIDETTWAEAVARREEGRRLLGAVSARWDELTEGL